MAGRGAVIALSLSIAVLLGAIAAQGASAEQTAFECIKTSNATSKFKDPHCLEPGAPAGGAEGYRHGGIAEGAVVKFTATNAATRNATTEPTPSILFSKNFLGVELEISCAGLTGSGTLENKGILPMEVEGSGKFEFTNCTVLKPANKCKVQEPIVAEVEGESVDGVGFMGVRLTGIGGGALAGIRFEDKSAVEICAATFKAGGAKPLTGSVEATANALPEGKGATTVVTPAMSALKLAGFAATLSATATLKSLAFGDALVLTTPPYVE
jgi:hypothetical protein